MCVCMCVCVCVCVCVYLDIYTCVCLCVDMSLSVCLSVCLFLLTQCFLALTHQVFGLGCGRNQDMTTDGAALWYAGISTASIAQANYYTTQYDKGGLFGEGWCNMLTNAMLVRLCAVRFLACGSCLLAYASSAPPFLCFLQPWCRTSPTTAPRSCCTPPSTAATTARTPSASATLTA
jgi:hypothetical protein